MLFEFPGFYFVASEIAMFCLIEDAIEKRLADGAENGLQFCHILMFIV